MERYAGKGGVLFSLCHPVNLNLLIAWSISTVFVLLLILHLISSKIIQNTVKYRIGVQMYTSLLHSNSPLFLAFGLQLPYQFLYIAKLAFKQRRSPPNMRCFSGIMYNKVMLLLLRAYELCAIV